MVDYICLLAWVFAYFYRILVGCGFAAVAQRRCDGLFCYVGCNCSLILVVCCVALVGVLSCCCGVLLLGCFVFTGACCGLCKFFIGFCCVRMNENFVVPFEYKFVVVLPCCGFV